MNENAEKFRILLDTYKLSLPVSPGDQEYIMKNRVPGLKAILRTAGRYSLFYWAAVLVFAWFRKFGVSITMVQGKIIAAFLAAAVASGSTAAAVSGARYILRVIEPQQERIEEKSGRAVKPAGEDGVMKEKGITPAGKAGKADQVDKPRVQEKKGARTKNSFDTGPAADVPSL
jgi:hypothetical protein